MTADHVSGGRVEVGIGAGWWEREHELYGFEFPPMGAWARRAAETGRDPPLSMITGWLVGTDREDLRDRARRLAEWQGEEPDREAFLAQERPSTIKGTVPEAVEQLQELAAVGLSRIMGQHLLHRDLDAVALMGSEIIPALAR